MEEIIIILKRIINIMQVLIILGSSASFIYLGIMTYLKKWDEAKKHLPWILLGLTILVISYSLPVIILSFLEVKNIPPFP